jgi:carbamoyltransferase
MKVLGISGRYREAAAAVAIDGEVIAAASEDSFVRVAGIGYSQTGGFPQGAVDACLEKTGLTLAELDRVNVVNDEGTPRAGADDESAGPSSHAHVAGHDALAGANPVDAIRADAIQAAAGPPDIQTVLVCSAHPPALAAFVRNGGALVPHARVSGAAELTSAARSLAASLGIGTDDPFSSLDRLSVGGEPEFESEFAVALSWTRERGVTVETDHIDQLLKKCAEDPARLADAESLNARVQESRRTLAASFSHALARLICDVAAGIRPSDGSSMVGLSGSMLANPRFNTELQRLGGGQLLRAALPEPVGRALGAALSPETRSSHPSQVSPESSARLSGLILGPSFTDYDIKRTLDNCRLDYVYEPDWSRLLGRVSNMLSQGKIIGWFQGPMAFGPRALGSRSVLCDPSARYARQNINEYLRHLPLDEPLPLVFAPSAIAACLGTAALLPARVVDCPVNAACRDRLSSALDWRNQVRVQPLDRLEAPVLCDLLERHLERTRVPALIEINLGGGGEPPACTPRDAVRTVYSSAIDALVMGRFLLMKDYWLLRSESA